MAMLIVICLVGVQPPEVVEEAATPVLAGRVIDPDGNSIEGATVDAWSWYQRNEAKTDEEGRFSVPRLSGSKKPDVKVTAPGRTPVYVAQQPFGEDIEYVLGSDTYVEGVIRKPDGTPAGGVKLLASFGPVQGDGVMIGEVTFTATTDAEGKYRLYAPPNSYEMQVVAKSTGFARERGVTIRGASEWNADLQRGATLTARVEDAESGEPFGGLTLFTWRPPIFKVTSDEDGALILEGLPAGEREFQVSYGEPERAKMKAGRVHGPMGRWWSPDAKTEWEREAQTPGQFQRNFDGLTFDIPEEGKEVTIYVERGVEVSGVVTDPDGHPVEGVTVAPAKTGSGNSITGDTRYSVKTDAEGKYSVVLPASKTAKINLIAHHGGYGEWRTWANARGEAMTTQPGERLADVNFTLNRPSIVRGHVQGAEAGVEVRAVPTDGLSNRYYVPTGRTLDDGSFEIRYVGPGQHMIQVAPFWLDPTQAPEGTSKNVTVEEGREVDGVELRQPR